MYKLSPHNDCLYGYTIATGKDYTSVPADLGYMQASITVHLLERLLYYLLKAQLRAHSLPVKSLDQFQNEISGDDLIINHAAPPIPVQCPVFSVP